MKVLIAALLVATVSPAFANMELAGKKSCLACHAVSRKLVGPAYKEVAAKYADDKNAVATLSEKVLKGSVGVWGQVPMPANNVTPEEAHQLVTWILSLK